MPSRHRYPPISVRPPELLREWLVDYAQQHDRSVRGVITEALEEYRARHEPEATHGMQAMTTEVARGYLHRAFAYNFMQPNRTAQAPIHFPGIAYQPDGTLAEGMQDKGTQHLIAVLRDNGCNVRHSDGTGARDALHHVLWDKWTQEEIGAGRFIGRLFDDHGTIYLGCTAIDAASYTLERLASLDAGLYSHTREDAGLR
jgi:hypothetical protein